MYPSLGFIETASIIKGFEIIDFMLKEAKVELVDAYAICPGKYLIFIKGNLRDVTEAIQKGEKIANEIESYTGENLSSTMINSFIIQNPHPYLIPGLNGYIWQNIEVESVGVFETYDVANCVFACDRAIKSADVRILEIRLAKGLAGKGYFIITGKVDAVTVAISEAIKSVSNPEMVVSKVVIPYIHQNLKKYLLPKIWSLQ